MWPTSKRRKRCIFLFFYMKLIITGIVFILALISFVRPFYEQLCIEIGFLRLDSPQIQVHLGTKPEKQYISTLYISQTKLCTYPFGDVLFELDFILWSVLNLKFLKFIILGGRAIFFFELQGSLKLFISVLNNF